MIASRRLRCERGCGRPAAPCRHICNTCRDKAWRKKHHVRHLWKNLKSSAKRRELPFTISFEWFNEWARKTGYAELVGRGKGCASCDRRESWRGYEPDNLVVLEFGANSAKGQTPPPINSDDRFYTEADDPYAT